MYRYIYVCRYAMRPPVMINRDGKYIVEQYLKSEREPRQKGDKERCGVLVIHLAPDIPPPPSFFYQSEAV